MTRSGDAGVIEERERRRSMSAAERLAETWRGMRRVRWRRYVVVGVVALVVVVAQTLLLRRSGEVWRETNMPKADSRTWLLSISLANTAALLLATALCIGPIRAIRTGRPAPAHLPWRRVVGVWSGLVASVHVPLAFALHIPGWRLWWPFVTGRPTPSNPLPIRTDDFALAYVIGLLAAAAMSVVLVTSNASSIRRFGVRRWKRIQRVAYLLGALVVVHVLFTQAFEFRSSLQRRLLWVVVALVLAIRVASYASLRIARTAARSGAPPSTRSA